MIAYLMIVEIDIKLINKAERRIKIFLTYYNNFEKEFIMECNKENENDDNKSDLLGFELNMYGEVDRGELYDDNINSDLMIENKTASKRKIPGWISSCNFVCLLNLPDAMREYGPLRNLWEGSYQGEGYLRVAKKHMKTGLRGNWTFNALKKILQEKSFFHILGKYRSKEDMQENTTEASYKAYYSYKSRYEAFYHYHAGKPLSIVQLENASFGFLFSEGNIFLPIKQEKYTGIINGCHYHRWVFVKDNIETDIMFGRAIINYCLLLPRYMITKEESHKEQYTLITNNWTEIQEDGSIKLPPLPSIS